jgi:hypothetical protein
MLGDIMVGELFVRSAMPQYAGVESKRTILNRLVNYPTAQAFAAKVCDFYGDYLYFYEDEAFEASHYQISLQYIPVALQYARIELQLGTPRTTEALVHELLHLYTRVNGYPIGTKFTVPYGLTQYADFIAGSYPKIVNILEHELIFDNFLDLGFSMKNFLGYLSPPPDYQKLAAEATASFGYNKKIGFSWWCLEYLRHWVSTRHWAGDEAEMYAESALYWGSIVHPEMRIIAQKIRDLIESGALKDTKNHHHCVNVLLELMRFPIFTEWVTILTHGDGKPVAIKLIDEGIKSPTLCRVPKRQVQYFDSPSS